ncbi:MAG TPA: Shedu anti-phage system protein SduA domain-containing protein [Chthoniobacter sp.]
MSDDYTAYLAYKRSKCSQVPVAILGQFPPDAAVTESVGGWELLPPAGIARNFFPAAPYSTKLKEWFLEEKLREHDDKKRPVDLMVTYLRFAEQLHDEDADEKRLHRYIERNPVVLSAYGTRLDSEVSLGQQYRIDLILRSTGVREEVILVELENHRHALFTRSGQPRAEITHAVQQVQDWFRWLRENPNNPVAVSIGGIPPRGLVVAGRSRDFSEEDRSRLAHLNTFSAVPVITYDELLDRFGDLVLGQLADERR